MYRTFSCAAVTLLLVASVAAQGHQLTVTVTNNLPNLYVDNVLQNITNGDNWQDHDTILIGDHVRLIAIQGLNLLEGCSGIMAATSGSSYGYSFVSDRTWRCSLSSPPGWMNIGFDDSNWGEPAYEVGINGVVPGCSWIPLIAFPSNAYWIWSDSFIDGHPIMHCRGYTPICSFAPCLNGGTCQINAGDLCLCPAHTTGQFCETQIDECESNPCQNGGLCELTESGYECTCPIGYSGVHCETDTSPCASAPCQNGATCHFDLEDGGYACSCIEGYTGDHCETMINYCESEPCQNGGSCAPELGGVVCTCVPGYTGGFCQIQINFCDSNPCLHASTCVPGINTYTCQCHSGWTGIHCESPIGLCGLDTCFNGGTCTLDGIGGAVQCLCPSGYFGQFCEASSDWCESNPCLNGGTCVTLQNGYQCNCLPAYTDTRCGTVIPNCGSIMLQSSYDPARDFWVLCEINIIDHPLHVNTPCRNLIVNINHYNTSEGIIAAGGTFGCFVTRFPDEMPNGACINNYNQDQTLNACLSCTHMGVCLNAPPLTSPGSKKLIH